MWASVTATPYHGILIAFSTLPPPLEHPPLAPEMIQRMKRGLHQRLDAMFYPLTPLVQHLNLVDQNAMLTLLTSFLNNLQDHSSADISMAHTKKPLVPVACQTPTVPIAILQVSLERQQLPMTGKPPTQSSIVDLL